MEKERSRTLFFRLNLCICLPRKDTGVVYLFLGPKYFLRASAADEISSFLLYLVRNIDTEEYEI